MQKFSYAKMAGIFERMAVSYSAGIDIRKILRRESEQGAAAQRETFQGIARRVDSGEALANAMAAETGRFPELVIAVVRAGESGGRLEQSFARLGAHYKSLVEFRQRFLQSVAWPLFQLFAAIAIVGGMILVLDFVYRLGNMQPIDWFGMGSTTGNFLLYVFVMAFLFGGLYLLYHGSVKGWFGLLPHRIARRIPLIGSTIESLALSRFAWTMSVAENAGMSAIETVQLALRATENYFFKALEPEITQDIQDGQGFYAALHATESFPDDLLVYVENGETAGELAETMNRASIDYQGRAERSLKAISGIGFVLIFGFVAVIIGATVILLFRNLYLAPIQDIQNMFP